MGLEIKMRGRGSGGGGGGLKIKKKRKKLEMYLDVCGFLIILRVGQVDYVLYRIQSCRGDVSNKLGSFFLGVFFSFCRVLGFLFFIRFIVQFMCIVCNGQSFLLVLLVLELFLCVVCFFYLLQFSVQVFFLEVGFLGEVWVGGLGEVQG